MSDITFKTDYNNNSILRNDREALAKKVEILFKRKPNSDPYDENYGIDLTATDDTLIAEINKKIPEYLDYVVAECNITRSNNVRMINLILTDGTNVFTVVFDSNDEKVIR